MRKTVTAKLALTSVASVFAVMAGFGIYSYLSEKSRLEAVSERNAAQLHERLLNTLRQPVFQFDHEQVNAVVSLEMKGEDVSRVVVRDEHGAVYVGKRKDEEGQVRDYSASDPAARCYRMLTGDIRVDNGAQAKPIGSVELCLGDDALQAALRSLVIATVSQIALVAVCLCLCIYVSLHLVLLRRILDISEAVSRFARKDFSSRSTLRGDDELGELSRNFNAMAETIQDHSENLERTIAERTSELVRKNALVLREKEIAEAATTAKTKLLAEQQELVRKLENAQGQLLQSEKLASIGQLAAGVAHEINNPIGFIGSNLSSLKREVDDLMALIAAYEASEPALAERADLLAAVGAAKAAADVDYLREDIPTLIGESLDGVQRVKRIVENLKDFSRVDTAEWQFANLEHGLESTLNIVWNEIKYKAEVVREYAGLPEIECIAAQINQVFLNLLVNAAHAIENRGIIILRTGFDETNVWVEVEDSGSGIKPEHLHRIFEPFFTTKPVGKGTGLGLSLAFGIVQRHHGKIEVRSEPGKGTVFRVTLPREREAADTAPYAKKLGE